MNKRTSMKLAESLALCLFTLLIGSILYFGGMYFIDSKSKNNLDALIPPKEPIEFQYPDDVMDSGNVIPLTTADEHLREDGQTIFNDIVVSQVVAKYQMSDSKDIVVKNVWVDSLTHKRHISYIYRLNIGGVEDVSVFVQVDKHNRATKVIVTKW